MSKERPMGVSQWMNHGKKYGYAKFWKERLLEEIIKIEKTTIGEVLPVLKGNGGLPKEKGWVPCDGREYVSKFGKKLVTPNLKNDRSGADYFIKIK